MREGTESSNIRLAMGVMLLSVSLLPLAGVFSNVLEVGGEIFGNNEDFSDSDGDSVYEKTAEQAFCEGVKKLIVREFLIPDGEVEVFASGFDVSSVRAEKIKVVLSGKSVYTDYRSLSIRIEELGLGKCEVMFDVG